MYAVPFSCAGRHHRHLRTKSGSLVKNFFKILGIVIGILIVIGAIFIVVIIRSLPSPAQIGRYLQPSTARSALATPTARPTTPPPTTDIEPTQTPEPPPAPTGPTAKDREENQKLLADLSDERLPLANVCAYMRNASLMPPGSYSLKDFGQRFKDSVLNEEKEPIVQSMKPALRFILTQPRMKSLIDEANAAVARGEDEGFFKKASFYAQAYAAYGEMKNNQHETEAIMDRTYFLMMMARAFSQKPELASDNYVAQYCQSIEKAVNDKVPVNLAEERAEFEKFLSSSNIDPKSIGYDPNYKTNIAISFNASGLRFKGGWIDSLIKPSREEIQAIEDKAKR